ncbi:site-2 protease family protein [Paenibacillus sp. P96]|uniref:Site-2 protease family protein n=1 Tax=Paenibacillus zeirhizosphaerae TaxID=2987519 RepID=A0ABT9FQL7_9BACL|nr:site-2 protease family protein [Paenibacillus sp. P96]MDP4097003.1 site-2 protease family protein [Paenibacillus sp. P96]
MDFLNSFFQFNLDELPFVLLTLIIAFTVHEFAHAYFANKFGDPTAKLLGRVTLNPAVHLDVLGTLLILIAGFGWAKPVPVNRDNFSRPRLMGIIVSAAGPLSNLLLAFLSTLIYFAIVHLGMPGLDSNPRVFEAVRIFFNYMITLNVLLFLFNLIPLPPLDGYRILEDIAPTPLRRKLQQFEQWSIFIFLLILVLPPLRAVTITPLYELVNTIAHGFASFAMLIFQ